MNWFPFYYYVRGETQSDIKTSVFARGDEKAILTKGMEQQDFTITEKNKRRRVVFQEFDNAKNVEKLMKLFFDQREDNQPFPSKV